MFGGGGEVGGAYPVKIMILEVSKQDRACVCV